MHWLRRTRRGVALVAAAGTGFVISALQMTSALALTSYSGALIERVTPSGFTAMSSSEPDQAAATAAQPNAVNGDIAGWGGSAISADSPTDVWASGYFTD